MSIEAGACHIKGSWEHYVGIMMRKGLSRLGRIHTIHIIKCPEAFCLVHATMYGGIGPINCHDERGWMTSKEEFKDLASNSRHLFEKYEVVFNHLTKFLSINFLTL